MKSLKILYGERELQFSEIAQRYKQQYVLFSFVRLIFFLAALGFSLLTGTWYWWAGLLAFLVFMGIFYQFVRWHLGIARKQEHAENLSRVNREEQAALNYDFGDFYFDAPVMGPEHPYAADLDIEGRFSLVQMLNRAGTTLGRKALRDFLCYPAGLDEITSRQVAVKELAPQLDWRQELQARGMETSDDPAHVEGLENWLKEKNLFAEVSWLKIARLVIPLWTLIAAIAIAPSLSWTLRLLLLLPAAWVIKRTLPEVNRIHEMTRKAGEVLNRYAGILSHIESGNYESEWLKTRAQALTTDDSTASEGLKKLAYIISQLDVRYNVFTILLNLSFLWDLQWVYRLERWKARYGDHLLDWFGSMQSFEAISSFANTAYNNPDWAYPEIVPEGDFESLELGHPLIAPEKRVCNDFSIPTSGHIKLITGSNMAGKSTFLRTVGINIALAMAGAPVCAARMRSPLLIPYTSMRTQDALHDNTSSFYAELKRLKFIIEAVEQQESGKHQPFFILDEILKGTNSEDRHTGAKALIQQLVKAGGTGLIATHDLELGKLEASYGGALENLCMEVSIEAGQLSFDYKLKKGVSRSFNATLLMREMGIRV